MGELGAFLKIHRVGFEKREPRERVGDYRQYFSLPDDSTLREQGARCMDCGVPFCHEGCPLGNRIPDWNDLVYRGRWRDALTELHATNDFPEFTGLICPAPCESACVLQINDDPVTIEQIELAIVTRGFDEGWIQPVPPTRRTGREVGVVGSGPAGLAVANQLNRLGHSVTVYERDEAPGGLLRYGVPDAKLEKWIITRRIELLEAEGIRFACGVDVGRDISASDFRKQHDAVVVAIGSRVPRELDVPGAELEGVHPAMDYLYQRNRWVARMVGEPYRDPEPGKEITAAGKRVVVVGGGDTGMDCVSNALREGAADVQLLDVYPELPASGRDAAHTVAAAAQAHADDIRPRRGRRASMGLAGDAGDRGGRQGRGRARAPSRGDVLDATCARARLGVRPRVRSRAGRDRVPSSRSGARRRPRARDATTAATSRRGSTARARTASLRAATRGSASRSS